MVVRYSFLLAAIVAVVIFTFASCGDAESDCADAGGIICNDCSGSGDCDITCGAGEAETCVGLEFFGGDNPEGLRCAFCE